VSNETAALQMRVPAASACRWKGTGLAARPALRSAGLWLPLCQGWDRRARRPARCWGSVCGVSVRGRWGSACAGCLCQGSVGGLCVRCVCQGLVGVCVCVSRRVCVPSPAATVLPAARARVRVPGSAWVSWAMGHGPWAWGGRGSGWDFCVFKACMYWLF